MKPKKPPVVDFRQAQEDMQRTFNMIEQLRMPVIAAIQSGCIQEINIGMAADLGTLQRWSKRRCRWRAKSRKSRRRAFSEAQYELK